MRATTLPRPKPSVYLPKRFQLSNWNELLPYYEELSQRPIGSRQELEQWLLDRSELDAFVSEAFAWRYIKITVDSTDEEAAAAYQEVVQVFAPRISEYENLLNRKLVDNPYTAQLEPAQYAVYLRGVRNAVALFREENIDLGTQVQLLSKEHGKTFSEMTVGVNGAQMTLQKAGTLLEEPNRAYREEVYHTINRRILQDADHLEGVFDQLLEKRHAIALNAGFDNFRDYRFRSLGRFDYSVQDCLDFHDSIASEILPLLDQLNEKRMDALGLNRLRPWDLHVDTHRDTPLRPFQHVDELLDKTIRCLNSLHPMFGEVLSIMRNMKRLDLDSRPGKRPGGYNMPLLQTGVPFIFMNATQSVGDMRTLMHESGHAIHAYLTRHLRLSASKKVPSEVAELAAMSMELLSMDHWQVFFDNEEDLRLAKLHQLETSLKVLPWIATIDKFQHWLYTHPQHAKVERRDAWMRIFYEFKSRLVDHDGLENYAAHLWHKQLHLFEVPFYYIEYGMAQLGAIAIWKQYREDPVATIERYMAALRLGYTRPIGEIYATAGISFDFSKAYVGELGRFIKSEIDKLA
jgi:oligoendopeptidase F